MNTKLAAYLTFGGNNTTEFSRYVKQAALRPDTVQAALAARRARIAANGIADPVVAREAVKLLKRTGLPGLATTFPMEPAQAAGLLGQELSVANPFQSVNYKSKYPRSPTAVGFTHGQTSEGRAQLDALAREALARTKAPSQEELAAFQANVRSRVGADKRLPEGTLRKVIHEQDVGRALADSHPERQWAGPLFNHL